MGKSRGLRLVIGPGVIDPEHLRSSLLAIILRWSVLLGVAVYIPSACFAFSRGMYGVIAVDTLVVASLVAAHLATGLSFRVRAIWFCLILYGLGLGLLIQVGSVSEIYLFGVSIMTALLLGLRLGLASVALGAVTLLGVGWIYNAASEAGAYDHAGWAVITLNFAVVNALLTLTVGAVIGAVDNALADRRRAETDRARALAALQLQIERMPLAYLLSDRTLRYTKWNPAAERMFGFAEAEVLGKDPFEVIVPRASQAVIELLFERVAAGSMDAHGTSENLTKDGRTILCEWHNTPVFDETGAFAGLLSLAQEITGRKALEEQLRQAQKMDAIGQLAGGVAHDFNNLLSVILASSEFLLEDLPETGPGRADVEEIRRAGLRAADLTRQLLMFSRQQVVEPKVLDLDELLSGVDKMLRRLLGEDIELTTVSGGPLDRVRADPGSIEQVIMNLVVNARDAMPIGGKLTMETANVILDEAYAATHFGATTGPHVMISVSDTGSGIDKPTLARIFEPFFTTKEMGKGTGLGLSTVFGIVQQHGGTVWVYSEVGIGTTFKVYLPRVDEILGEVRAAAVTTSAQRGSETILLVEDEGHVRDVAHGILLRHGYEVLAARSAGEALLVCEQHVGPIHLLLSDVVMPQLGGPALAKRLVAMRPDMRVLCMSGYTDDAAVRHGVIAADFAYLQKPLTAAALTGKVRSVLDGATR